MTFIIANLRRSGREVLIALENINCVVDYGDYIEINTLGEALECSTPYSVAKENILKYADETKRP